MKWNKIIHNDEQATSGEEKKDVVSFFKDGKITREQKEKAWIVFLLGVFFLLIASPFSKRTPPKTKQISSKEDEVIAETPEKDAYIDLVEHKLEKTIGEMEGAGKVVVMVTLKNNGEKILDKNQPYESQIEKSREEGKESEHNNIKSSQETVLVNQQGDTEPIVIQEKFPAIEGVVVVCEGGDDAALEFRIKEAVSALFSIDSHKVVVCKLQQ